MMPNIMKSYIERPRVARELYEWVQRVHGEFGKTAEGKSALRRRSALYLKELLEEIWPLANYALLFFPERSDVRFQPVIGNESYDALLVDESGSTLCYFEITQALHGEAGYQDRLRREHLEQYGHAPLTGPPLRRDPDSGFIAETLGECVDHSDAVEITFCQIRAAIEAKATKVYPANTALIVEFQGIHLQQPNDQAALDALAKSTLCDLASRFSELALIDEISRFGFRYLIPGRRAA
ncbi:MAG: hypothetical protein ABIF87_16460 [Pseudomonadota bacterium]